MLAPVECAGGATKIRVAMYAFTRLEVAKRLTALRKGGCKVYVVLNDETDGSSKTIGTEVRQKLKAGGLNVLSACDPETALGLHSKYLLIEGTYAGTPGRSLVLTGSHNYTHPSLRGHDETVLKIDDYGVYSKFEANFEDDIYSYPGCTTSL